MQQDRRAFRTGLHEVSRSLVTDGTDVRTLLLPEILVSHGLASALTAVPVDSNRATRRFFGRYCSDVYPYIHFPIPAVESLIPLPVLFIRRLVAAAVVNS